MKSVNIYLRVYARCDHYRDTKMRIYHSKRYWKTISPFQSAYWSRCIDIYNFRRQGNPLQNYYLISVNYAVSVIVVMKTILIFSFIRDIFFTPWKWCDGVSTLLCRWNVKDAISSAIMYGILIWCDYKYSTRGLYGLCGYGISQPFTFSMTWSVVCVYDSTIDRWSAHGYKLAYIVMTDLLMYFIHLEPNTVKYTVWSKLYAGKCLLFRFRWMLWCNCTIYLYVTGRHHITYQRDTMCFWLE